MPPAKKPKKTGRPPLLTPERKDQLLQLLGAGNYRSTAAEYVGIGTSTLYRWLEWGREEADRLDSDPFAAPDPDRAIYKEFWEEVTRAERQAEVRAVALWQQAMRDDWRAAKEYLARKHPDRWGDQMRLMGADGGAVQVEVTPSDLAARIKALAADLPTVDDGDGA